MALETANEKSAATSISSTRTLSPLDAASMVLFSFLSFSYSLSPFAIFLSMSSNVLKRSAFCFFKVSFSSSNSRVLLSIRPRFIASSCFFLELCATFVLAGLTLVVTVLAFFFFFFAIELFAVELLENELLVELLEDAEPALALSLFFAFCFFVLLGDGVDFASSLSFTLHFPFDLLRRFLRV